MNLRDDGATQPERLTEELPRTVPGSTLERLGRPVEPRSEEHEERILLRICVAMRDADGFWSSTHLVRARHLAQSLVLAMGPRPLALPG